MREFHLKRRNRSSDHQIEPVERLPLCPHFSTTLHTRDYHFAHRGIAQDIEKNKKKWGIFERNTLLTHH